MHIPVLRDESIDGLAIKSGDIVVDGTLGGGGHTLEMIRRFGSGVKILGLDFDSDAIERAKKLIDDMPHDAVFRTIGFHDIDKVLSELNIPHVDRILLDLGLSSFQLDVSGRGFSFLRDEPLLMTMKKNPTEEDLTARDIVNTWEEKTLADIIFGFGEEKFSRKIAKAIVEARSIKPIETTFDLANIIDKAVGRSYRGLRIHPCTRTFQALRIATNSELSNLEKVIEKGFSKLSIGGRMAIISFHSLEDRIVKRAFVDLKQKGYVNIITKKPITPNDFEIKENPRARSAKLRIIEKIQK
jgi:16S rRNA (cytosine1402-N4)-methyltransferase